MSFQEPAFFSKQIHQAKRFYKYPTEKRIPEVAAGGREICSPGYKIKRKNFPFIALEFVSSGQGKLTLKDKTYSLDPGTIFVYGPNFEHSIESSTEKPLEKYFVNVQPNKELLEWSLYGCAFHTSRPQSILLSFEELIDFGLDPSPLAEKVCEKLFRLIIEKAEYSVLPHGKYSHLAYHSYRRCKTIIETNYIELKSTEETAELCGISKTHICRLFARYDHQSPYRYLMGLKMNYAADLILTHGLSVKETAGKLGYEDQGHFSRAFKRSLGIAPSALGNNRL
ncbi:MAG: helix-turn-helix domain-containing protein [Spirochaetales bacterium]|nr:helix-turn-helix domain-containing protein [Spirochaetales bacterium]